MTVLLVLVQDRRTHGEVEQMLWISHDPSSSMHLITLVQTKVAGLNPSRPSSRYKKGYGLIHTK